MNLTLWKEGFLFILLVILASKLMNNLKPIWLSIQNFFEIITPFIIGFAVAYFLNAPCNKIEKKFLKSKSIFVKKHSRGLSILILYAIVIFIITLIISYVFPLIVTNILDFAGLIPSYYNTIIQFIEGLDTEGAIARFDVDVLLAAVTDNFSVQEIISRITMGLGSIGGYALVMTSGIVNTFLSIIISLYTLLYKESLLSILNRIAKAFIKDNSLKTIKYYVHKTNEVFYKFISCQFLDACILGTLATILLSLLGVRYSVTLGIMLGVCNMIPYFGSIFASIVTVIITIFTGGLNLALVTGISLLILQQIDGNIIGPKLMGGALNLNPILIIFSIIVGGAYFGVIGMFLSVPVAAMLKIIMYNLIEIREQKHLKTNEEV